MSRILFFDIETSPLITYNWRTYKSDALDVYADFQILCFAYKWKGDEKVTVISQDDFPDWVPGVNNDIHVVEKLRELFNEADILVAHNGDSFDVKRAHARMMYHKLTPPEPSLTVDTFKEAKKIGGFSSNKLALLVKQLGLGKKMDSGGVETFLGALEGDVKCWKHLKKYNKMDVIILERLYRELLPWMKNHPSLAVIDDQPSTCPRCGSSHLRKGGFYATKTGRRKRYQCLSCGGWTMGRKIYRNVDLKYV